MKDIRHSSLKPLLLAVVAILAVFMPTSCQKSSINGDLDGQWQVMEVTPTPTTVIKERLYYAFYMHSCMLTFYGGGGDVIQGAFSFKDNKLSISFPYATSPKHILRLKQYGINTNPVNFEIIHLDSKRLVLKDGDTYVSLRKF